MYNTHLLSTRATVTLMTTLSWWPCDDDIFKMLVAESLCWRLFSLGWWFSQCIKSITNILNRSPTSQTCHQRIWSPTSVTNIDVTCWNYKIIDSAYVLSIQLDLRGPIQIFIYSERWQWCWSFIIRSRHRHWINLSLRYSLPILVWPKWSCL